MNVPSLIIGFLLLVLSTPSWSQEFIAEMNEEIVEEKSQCITEGERTHIQMRLKQTLKKLNLPKPDARESVQFVYPIKMVENDQFYSAKTISNYLDHNPVATGSKDKSSTLDFHCGHRSYDRASGYNHDGIDFATWPFSWYLFDNELVDVIAGEAGVIIGKDDGHKDDNCSCEGSWNAVYIRHDDGSTAWYGHLKKHTLTDKAVGDRVDQGEYLGKVGSSGCSTGPHLHLEVYDADGNLIDPYQGECNELNDESWWQEQEDYRVPTLNAVTIGNRKLKIGCWDKEVTSLDNQLLVGDTVYINCFFRDQIIGDGYEVWINRPNGSLVRNWSKTFTKDLSSSYWWRSFRISSDFRNIGDWTVTVRFGGEDYVKHFTVSEQSTNVSQDLADAEVISVYNNVIEISSDINATSVSIIDTQGKMIHIVENQHTISMDRFPTGLYAVTVWDNATNKRYTRRVFASN